MSKLNSTSSGFIIEPEQDFHSDPLQTLSRSVSPRSLSSISRMLGACAVLASLAMFLLDGWNDGNDLYRYLKLLGLTGLITGAGILLSFVFKEVKGARVFFGLGLVATASNFMILGALTYSMVQLDSALGDYPSILRWQTVDVSVFIPIAIAAITLLAVLCRFSFGIFARAEASKLTLAFLALNSLFLIPVRETTYISILSAIALLIATTLSLKIVKGNTQLLTREAKYSIACLFLPGLLMIARALGLYSMDEIMLITIFGLLFYALRTIGLIGMSEDSKPGAASKVSYWSQHIAGLGLAASAALLVPSQVEEFGITVFSAVLIAVSFDLAKNRNTNSNQTSTMLSLTSIMLTITNVTAALVSSSSLEIACSFLTLLAWVSTIQFLLPVIPKLRSTKITGLLGIVATGALLLINILGQFNLGSWIWFAVAGMSLIIGASIYERYSLNLIAKDHERVS